MVLSKAAKVDCHEILTSHVPLKWRHNLFSPLVYDQIYCAAVLLVHAHSLTWLSGIINGVEPSLTLLVTLVLFLLRQATMSGGKVSIKLEL